MAGDGRGRAGGPRDHQLDVDVHLVDVHDLDLVRTVVCELPARALLDTAAGADILVVGARGLGGMREVLLGSVTREVVDHAPCPVVIVRHEPPAA